MSNLLDKEVEQSVEFTQVVGENSGSVWSLRKFLLLQEANGAFETGEGAQRVPVRHAIGTV